ncbi:hypothetical protein FQA39_LY04535 [Lamprigera yunnana]|nr:hypothetical protein FQA39_LY04535 [Lamprigera yunnana]
MSSNLRGKHLHAQTREVAFNVNQWIKSQNEDQCTKEIKEKVSRATGVSIRTIESITKEGSTSPEAETDKRFKSPEKKRKSLAKKKMNSAEAFVIFLYNPKHKILRKNLVKHKFKSHPLLYKKDLDASYKINLDAQDAAGYAVNDDEMKRLNEISKVIGEPEYWD